MSHKEPTEGKTAEQAAKEKYPITETSTFSGLMQDAFIEGWNASQQVRLSHQEPVKGLSDEEIYKASIIGFDFENAGFRRGAEFARSHYERGVLKAEDKKEGEWTFHEQHDSIGYEFYQKSEKFMLISTACTFDKAQEICDKLNGKK